jgi:hypothetical protein
MKTKSKSGGTKMQAAGYKPVQLWLTLEQHKKLFAAASADGRPATQFLLFHGLKAAETILRKNGR